MSSQVIASKIRGFISLNAHPAGCAANADAEIAVATAGAPGAGLGDALVVGASTGYGLSSLASAVFGYGARATAVCLERPPQGDKTASAGWYNLAALQRRAREAGRELSAVNGDAFSREVKQQTLAHLKKVGAKLDSGRLQPGCAQAGRPGHGNHLQLGAEADRRLVPQQERQPGQRPGHVRRDRARHRRRDRGDAQGDGRRGLRRLDARAGRRGPAGARLPRRGLQLHRAGADLSDLSLGHDRQGEGRPGGEDARAFGLDGRARGRCGLCGRHEGAGHAGVGGHPGGPALHQPAVQGDEGSGHARGNGRADRPPVPRPPGAGLPPHRRRGWPHPAGRPRAGRRASSPRCPRCGTRSRPKTWGRCRTTPRSGRISAGCSGSRSRGSIMARRWRRTFR